MSQNHRPRDDTTIVEEAETIDTSELSSDIQTLSAQDVEKYDTARLLCELCASFYTLGWTVGTGGGLSIQDRMTDFIFLSPSGVHKERMTPADLFVYDSRRGRYIYRPASHKNPSASASLFLWLHEHHGAGAVIHTHSMYSNLATRSSSTTTTSSSSCSSSSGPSPSGTTFFEVTNQEYIKGLPNYATNQPLKNTDRLSIPIIANQLTEDLLLPDLIRCVTDNPAAPCVLVRNHGAYHFGRDVWKCKAQTECLEYLFELDWKIKHSS